MRAQIIEALPEYPAPDFKRVELTSSVPMPWSPIFAPRQRRLPAVEDATSDDQFGADTRRTFLGPVNVDRAHQQLARHRPPEGQGTCRGLPARISDRGSRRGGRRSDSDGFLWPTTARCRHRLARSSARSATTSRAALFSAWPIASRLPHTALVTRERTHADDHVRWAAPAKSKDAVSETACDTTHAPARRMTFEVCPVGVSGSRQALPMDDDLGQKSPMSRRRRRARRRPRAGKWPGRHYRGCRPTG